MYIATAGAAANLAEIPARYVIIDEVDRLEVNVDGEGDPVRWPRRAPPPSRRTASSSR
jgi:phage terminase large subunit GpA-like protein